MKLIERQILIKRRAIIRRGVGMFQGAIHEQYHQALAIIHTANFDEIESRIRNAVSVDPIQRVFENYYPMASDFGVMWHNKLTGQKAETDYLYHGVFKNILRNYAKSKAIIQRQEQITKTTEDHILTIAQETVAQGLEAGFSVQKIRANIIEGIINQGKEITGARAKMIAQTEMVTASNMAASEAAKDVANQTGQETRKFWSTSGLPNVRDSHLAAEAESLQKNGLSEDETFESCPGMAYPGDPAGDAGDIVNCRCSILYEIV